MSNHTPEPKYATDLERSLYKQVVLEKKKNQSMRESILTQQERYFLLQHDCERLSAEIAKLKAENEQWSADFWKLHKERTNVEREVARLNADRARLLNFVRLVESSVSAATPDSVIGKAAKLLIKEMEAQK